MYKILLIEDEPAYQKVLKDAFELGGFNVTLAPNGKKGLIEAARNRPDFILLDLMMPVMNGSTVLRHINDIDGLEKVPLGILSVVPDGVPQSLDPHIYKNIVGYWVKDQESLPGLVQKVKSNLESYVVA